MSYHTGPARCLPALTAFLVSLALALAPATALAADPITVADFRLPQQDANGWTRLAPSADSRLVYVDSQQGNDASGTIYLPGDPEIGANPQSPRGTVRAFRTIAAAQAGSGTRRSTSSAAAPPARARWRRPGAAAPGRSCAPAPTRASPTRR